MCIDLCRVPQAEARHGRARQSSGTEQCGDCRRSFVCLIRGVSIRGNLGLSRNTEYKTRRVDMWLNVVLKSKFRYGTYRCELWVFLPPLPHRESVFGVNSFYRAQGGNWAQETCAGCP